VEMLKNLGNLDHSMLILDCKIFFDICAQNMFDKDEQKQEIFDIHIGPFSFGATLHPNTMLPVRQAEIDRQLLLTCQKACCPTCVLHCSLATCRAAWECTSSHRPHTTRPTGLHSKNVLGPMQAARSITVALWPSMFWERRNSILYTANGTEFINASFNFKIFRNILH
jgi:hypothetical protein